MQIDVLIEGVLFYKASPLTKKELQALLSVSEEEIAGGIAALRARLTGGIALIETESEVQLVTAPVLSEVIEAIQKDELRADIGKAGAETLAIILYREPITRAEIDRIRGVNSSFILRNLMVRGLVERVATPKRGGHAYTITPALLAHLGVTNKRELPQFGTILSAIERFEEEMAATPA